MVQSVGLSTRVGQVADMVSRARVAATASWTRQVHGQECNVQVPRVQWTAIEEDDQVEPRGGASAAVGATGVEDRRSAGGA